MRKTYTYQRTPKTPRKQSLVVLMITFVCILPISLMVVLTIQASHQGVEVQSLDEQIRALQEENRALTTQIVKESSLTELTRDFSEEDYQSPDKIIYIKKNNSLAQLP